MLELGTWSIPHFNHLPYLDKPVLLFWAIAAAFRTLGVTEFAARLPSALGAIATVALTFAMQMRRWTQRSPMRRQSSQPRALGNTRFT